MNGPAEVDRHGWWSPTTRTEAKKKLEKVRGSPPSSTKEQMVNTQPPGLTRAQAMQKVLDLLEVPEAEVGQAPKVTLVSSEAMRRTVCTSLVTQLMDTAAALTREMDVEARRQAPRAAAAKTAAEIEMCETGGGGTVARGSDRHQETDPTSKAKPDEFRRVGVGP